MIPAAPKLSPECRIDVLFLLASSADTTLEGFLRAKAFVKQFVQASLGEDSRARVGVARYSSELMVAVPVGEYQDVPDLLRSLDGISFGGGATLTGSALRQAAERGFGSAARTGQDRPRRVVVLLTESPSQDDVAGPARRARARELLLLGVGTEAVRAELEEITGSPERVLVYAGPHDLFRQTRELQGKLCSRPPPGEVPGLHGASSYEALKQGAFVIANESTNILLFTKVYTLFRSWSLPSGLFLFQGFCPGPCVIVAHHAFLGFPGLLRYSLC